MRSLLDLVAFDGGEGRIRGNRVEVARVADELAAGEGLGEVASRHHLKGRDLIAALASLGLGPEGSEGPDLSRARPRRPALARVLDEAGLAAILPGSDRKARLALSAGLLQILDFWDASHAAAQEADDLGERHVSAFWHGIAHRRESDPGNAAYWFRRVGRHAIFRDLAIKATALVLAEGRPDLAGRLAPGESWDPFAFIEYCGRAARDPHDHRLARCLQRLEMDHLLLETWIRASARSNERGQPA